MLKLLCVDPITANPTDFVNILKSNAIQSVYFEKEKIEVKRALELNCWQIWIQEGPGNEHFCIQYIECQNPSELIKAVKEQTIVHNRYTTRLQHIFQTYLAADYSLKQPVFKIEMLLELPISTSHCSQTYHFCYMLPLLPDQLEEHREYCRAAMNENRKLTIAACQAFGMVHLKKWIQISDNRNYVLYYQEMTQPHEKAREAFLTLKNNPKALQATQTLRNHTGLSFEELSPRVTCIDLFLIK
jgi:hypothetical protein